MKFWNSYSLYGNITLLPIPIRPMFGMPQQTIDEYIENKSWQSLVNSMDKFADLCVDVIMGSMLAENESSKIPGCQKSDVQNVTRQF